MSELDELLLKELREIVLNIRQYLVNTEFAPEPFTEPINPDKLTVEFPTLILAKVQAHYEHLIEEAKKQEGERIYSRGDFLLRRCYETSMAYEVIKQFWQALKVEKCETLW